jgi:phosphoribosylanthranilate isomerase
VRLTHHPHVHMIVPGGGISRDVTASAVERSPGVKDPALIKALLPLLQDRMETSRTY